MPDLQVEQLSRIFIFSTLKLSELQHLLPHTAIRNYQQGEAVMQEGDRLPAQLYALVSGKLQVTKTAATGKVTILRTLSTGEIFAAPALLGNGIAPATVTAETNCQVLTMNRQALLEAIQQTPEIALQMLAVFNQRLQQLHETVHGLVSERAIVRLARFIQYAAAEGGTDIAERGNSLRSPLPYYLIARSIGITYEECVRLFKQLQPCISYSRGGKITVLNWDELEAIARGETEIK